MSLRGIYNQSSSRTIIDLSVEQYAVVDFSDFENEHVGSVLVIRAMMRGDGAKVIFSGGGNYHAHSHLIFQRIGKEAKGTVQVSGVTLAGGQLELAVDDGLNLELASWEPSRSAEVALSLRLPSDINSMLESAGCDPAKFAGETGTSCWIEDSRNLPSGRELAAYAGGREFSHQERDDFGRSSNPDAKPENGGRIST